MSTKPGRIRLRVAQRVDEDPIRAFLIDNVGPGSSVSTDGRLSDLTGDCRLKNPRFFSCEEAVAFSNASRGA